jgi:hypothetical protein
MWIRTIREYPIGRSGSVPIKAGTEKMNNSSFMLALSPGSIPATLQCYRQTKLYLCEVYSEICNSLGSKYWPNTDPSQNIKSVSNLYGQRLHFCLIKVTPCGPVQKTKRLHTSKVCMTKEYQVEKNC